MLWVVARLFRMVARYSESFSTCDCQGSVTFSLVLFMVL